MQSKIKESIEGFAFTIHPDEINMILLAPNDIMGNFMYILNKWLFYTKEPYFVSILKNDNEINIMVSSKLIKESSGEIKYKKYPKSYNIIQIIEGTRVVSVSGIIHNLTGLFAEKNIPILYNSTYLNDYIFVEEGFIDEAINILEKNNLRKIEIEY